MINILSLFDGIACGRQALKNLNMGVENYFASEIDKYPMVISGNNHPEIKQLGDVSSVDTKNLPKIDLLLAGSPCQGFSNAGVKKGFSDDRSNLFFQFLRVLEETNPTYFLLENVSMKKEWLARIDSYVGVKGVLINSNSFSAQSRPRYYWTNIPMSPIPPMSATCIRDILDLDAPKFNKEGYKFLKLDSHSSKVGLMCLGAYLGGNDTLRKSDKGVFSVSQIRTNQRVYSSWGKHPCIMTSSGGLPYIMVNSHIRKPTLLELERIQTLPDGYTKGIPKSHRLKAIGNGWNVATIEFILRGLINEKDSSDRFIPHSD